MRNEGGGATNSATYTAAGGMVTFTGTFNNNVGDMVSALDATFSEGQVAVFSHQPGTQQYLFMQGGNGTGTGVADDLVVAVGTEQSNQGFTGMAIVGATAISLSL